MTIKEYLQSIVNELNKESDKEYEVRCFVYPVEYQLYGTKHDYPVGGAGTKEEGVIAIAAKDFVTDGMFQGYLCYPEEHPDFYEKGNFILCYGPSAKLTDFDTFMQTDITEIDSYKEYYGLEEKELSPKALRLMSDSLQKPKC